MERQRNKLQLFNKLRANLMDYLETSGIEIPLQARSLDNSTLIMYLQLHICPHLNGNDFSYLEQQYSDLLFEHESDINKIDKDKVKKYILAMCELIS